VPYPEPGPLDYHKIMWALFRFRFWKPKSEKVRRHEDTQNDTKDDTTSTQAETPTGRQFSAVCLILHTRWSQVCPNAWVHACGDLRWARAAPGDGRSAHGEGDTGRGCTNVGIPAAGGRLW